MSPLSKTEKQRRWRAHKKLAADPVRGYLRAVLDMADRERDEGQMTATTRRLASIAARLLDLPPAPAQHPWAAFARREGITAAFAAEKSAEREQAATTLRWAHDKVLGGHPEPREVREGLHAARTIMTGNTKFDMRALTIEMARRLSGVAYGVELAPMELRINESAEEEEGQP